MTNIGHGRPTTVLDRGYQRAVGCLYYPLPLVLVWVEPRMRSVYNPTRKTLRVEWWDKDKLSAVRTVDPFTISGKGRCTEIREYLM